MTVYDRRFRLADRSGALGVSFDQDGLSLAGAPLLRRTITGLVPRPANELGVLMKGAYGGERDVAALTAGLSVVAEALNQGDEARAMIAALRLRLAELDWRGAVRIAAAQNALAKYSPDQPRDWHGRWTNGDDDGAASGGTAEAAPARVKPAGPPVSQAPVRPPQAGGSWDGPVHLEGGRLIPIAGGGIGSNGPPADRRSTSATRSDRAKGAIGLFLRGYREAPGAQHDRIGFGASASASAWGVWDLKDYAGEPRADGQPRPLRVAFVFPVEGDPFGVAAELLRAGAALGAEYGYVFVRDELCLPTVYGGGGSAALDDSPLAESETDENGSWWRYVLRRMWQGELRLRDLFQLNLLSARHLAEPIEGLGLLADWVNARARAGATGGSRPGTHALEPERPGDGRRPAGPERSGPAAFLPRADLSRPTGRLRAVGAGLAADHDIPSRMGWIQEMSWEIQVHSRPYCAARSRRRRRIGTRRRRRPRC